MPAPDRLPLRFMSVIASTADLLQLDVSKPRSSDGIGLFVLHTSLLSFLPYCGLGSRSPWSGNPALCGILIAMASDIIGCVWVVINNSSPYFARSSPHHVAAADLHHFFLVYLFLFFHVVPP